MYDCIVLGTGGIGSAAMWQLAKRGHRVLGLDRFPAGHDRGSSHGQTRVIRQVYFEHPDYVPLLRRSYQLWTEACQGTKESLWTQTGLVQLGPADGEVIRGVLESARQHKLPVEVLTPEEHARRFPHLGLAPGMVSVFEPTGGVLRVEACVERLLELASRHNAHHLHGIDIHSVVRSGPNWRVETDRGPFESRRVIVAAGAWTGDLIPVLGPWLKVLRKVLLWYEADPASCAKPGPPFLYELPGGVFYGFPGNVEGRVKVARHTDGLPVDDPLKLDRTLRVEDHRPVDEFVGAWLHHVKRPQPCQHAVCMYTMSPDQHFVLGSTEPGLAVAAGLSGHGYKFAPVIGEALADIAMQGGTDLPIEFLAPDRLFP